LAKSRNFRSLKLKIKGAGGGET